MKVQQEGNPNAGRKKKKSKVQSEVNDTVASPHYMVPDRVTGLQELEELRQLCPGRVWNFVCVIKLSIWRLLYG